MKTNKLTLSQFYILSFTWGIIMSLIGCLVTVVLLVAGYRPKRNLYGWYFEVGENWGGVEFGCMCVVNKNPVEYTLNHEFGHAVQNCYFGPGMILISLASAARYWYREYLIKVKKKSYSDLPDYDSIWFEGDATEIGTFYRNN
jgi:hypothetical protein